MKALITGITGFVGPHLANLLFKEGIEIYGLVRGSNGMESDILDVVSLECFNSIKFLYGNLEDRDSLKKIFQENRFDWVFNLAAQSHPPTSLVFPLDTFRTNIMGCANLIDVIENNQPTCKLMQCSTSEIYGNAGRSGQLLKETDNVSPSNPYGVSKAAIDLYMQERMMNGKIQGFITRSFSHTGPRRGKNFSISSDAYQIANIMTGHRIPVIDVGNLETTRVVCDVRDVAIAYFLLMNNENTFGGIYNICGEVPRKMRFFTDYLIKLSGMDIDKAISPKYYRDIDIQYQHGDSSELKRITGWHETIPIEKTLEDLLHYWIQKIK